MWNKANTHTHTHTHTYTHALLQAKQKEGLISYISYNLAAIVRIRGFRMPVIPLRHIRCFPVRTARAVWVVKSLEKDHFQQWSHLSIQGVCVCVCGLLRHIKLMIFRTGSHSWLSHCCHNIITEIEEKKTLLYRGGLQCAPVILSLWWPSHIWWHVKMELF